MFWEGAEEERGRGRGRRGRRGYATQTQDASKIWKEGNWRNPLTGRETEEGGSQRKVLHELKLVERVVDQFLLLSWRRW